MKRITSIIILLLLVPSITHAYVEYYRTYPIFSFGLSPLTLQKETVGEGFAQQIVIQGDGLSEVKLEKGVYSSSTKEISVQPGFVKHWGDYDFWKINGTYNKHNFFIIGLTIEGDFIDNKIIKHIGGVVLLFIIITVILIKRIRRKKNKNIS